MKYEMVIRIKISRNSFFSGSDKPSVQFFLLIYVKMPTIEAISSFFPERNKVHTGEESRSVYTHTLL